MQSSEQKTTTVSQHVSQRRGSSPLTSSVSGSTLFSTLRLICLVCFSLKFGMAMLIAMEKRKKGRAL